MSEVTMTLYEARSKCKIYEDKVSKLQSFRLVDVKKKYENISTSGQEIENVKKSIDAGFQSSVATLDNYIALKSAINEANARIEVEIAGETYTIANAIVRQRLLDKQEMLYMNMLRNLAACEEDANKSNKKYLDPDAVSKYVSNVLGDSKKDEALIANVTQQYKEKYEVEVYDPLNTKEMAEKKLEEIKKFREEIHFALTQANCNNSITVELAD